MLDAGCGAGPLTEWLVGQGAEVTGFDVSAAMLGIARRRTPAARLVQAECRRRFPDAWARLVREPRSCTCASGSPRRVRVP